MDNADNQATGFVSLIGAGPGDPELLTRKAVARLRAADLVLYDALVDARVLRLARAGAAVLRRESGPAATRCRRPRFRR